MQDIINVAVNNGLGVCSFIALIVFIFKYQSKANDILEEINKSLIILNERVDKLEKEKIENDKG